jgi:hypothetical protein
MCAPGRVLDQVVGDSSVRRQMLSTSLANTRVCYCRSCADEEPACDSVALGLQRARFNREHVAIMQVLLCVRLNAVCTNLCNPAMHLHTGSHKAGLRRLSTVSACKRTGKPRFWPAMLSTSSIKNKDRMAANTKSQWLAANPAKRWTEVFFLIYSPFWILWALCILVPFKLYEVRRSLSSLSP